MPPEDGEILAADLYKMLVEARGTLPGLAETYAQSAQELASVGSQAKVAFELPDDLSSGETHPQWAALRSLLESVLSNTADSVHQSATYLVKTVDAYTEQDEAARTRLEEIMTACDPPDEPQLEGPV